MISLIEREVVDKYHWIERDEFLDLLAVAQSIPGILAVNIATVVGDRLRSGRGAATAAFATVLPCFITILIIAIFLTPDMIKNNRVISSIFMGIRPAVVAMIVAPVLTSAKAAKIGWRTVWIPALTALLISLDLGVISNPILFIILGGVGGYAYWKYSSRKARLAVGEKLEQEDAEMLEQQNAELLNQEDAEILNKGEVEVHFKSTAHDAHHSVEPNSDSDSASQANLHGSKKDDINS